MVETRTRNGHPFTALATLQIYSIYNHNPDKPITRQEAWETLRSYDYTEHGIREALDQIVFPGEEGYENLKEKRSANRGNPPKPM